MRSRSSWSAWPTRPQSRLQNEVASMLMARARACGSQAEPRSDVEEDVPASDAKSHGAQGAAPRATLERMRGHGRELLHAAAALSRGGADERTAPREARPHSPTRAAEHSPRSALERMREQGRELLHAAGALVEQSPPAPQPSAPAGEHAPTPGGLVGALGQHACRLAGRWRGALISHRPQRARSSSFACALIREKQPLRVTQKRRTEGVVKRRVGRFCNF